MTASGTFEIAEQIFFKWYFTSCGDILWPFLAVFWLWLHLLIHISYLDYHHELRRDYSISRIIMLTNTAYSQHTSDIHAVLCSTKDLSTYIFLHFWYFYIIFNYLQLKVFCGEFFKHSFIVCKNLNCCSYSAKFRQF